MKNILVVVVLACSSLTMAHCAPVSRTQTGAPKANPTAANKKKDKLVCRYERPTGSHFPKKTCRWASDAEQRSKNDQMDMQRAQSRGNVNTGTPE